MKREKEKKYYIEGGRKGEENANERERDDGKIERNQWPVCERMRD